MVYMHIKHYVILPKWIFFIDNDNCVAFGFDSQGSIVVYQYKVDCLIQLQSEMVLIVRH